MLVVLACVLLGALVLALDLSASHGVTAPLFYGVVLLPCLKLPWPRAALVVATAATLLTIGATRWAPGSWPELLNRAVALVTLWGLAGLLYRGQLLRAKLAEARAMAERAGRCKARFLAAAGHELRHPIHAGVLFHDLLSRRLRGTPHQDLVSNLGQSFEAMKRMLDGLLEVSRLDFGAIEPRPGQVAVGAIFERLLPLYAPQATSAGLQLTVVGTRAVVVSDPELLLRLVQNLLDNAIKHTEQGRVVLGCRRAGNSLRIQVWDSGGGIPSDQLRDIFEEFHQLRRRGREGEKGLGLGLAVVERLAGALGHAVAVRSVIGRGSVFEVMVPLAARSRALAANNSPS